MAFKKSLNLNRKSLVEKRKDQTSTKRDSTITGNLYYLAFSEIKMLI